ncbi:MAG: hypothetical protein EXR27_22095 [Betaproteobacteria bacterium]|nr:hypothetical protein [Betaproteobacteria bacterium]
MPAARAAATSVLAALLFGICSAGLAQKPEPVSGAMLAEELRKGGYILYFRHTRTLPEHDWETRMRARGSLSLADCSTQRNLSEEGFHEAKRQGEAITRLGIASGKVYASGYCRARQHAAFVAPQFVVSAPLTPVRDPAKALALRAMLNTVPEAGTNTLIFAHGGILWQATDFDSAESETFVFRPVAGAERAQLVASIRMDEWELIFAGRPCCSPRPFWTGTNAPPE